MEGFESYDVHQVVAALGNLPVKTLLMVGDVHQRVERGRRNSQRVGVRSVATAETKRSKSSLG